MKNTKPANLLALAALTCVAFSHCKKAPESTKEHDNPRLLNWQYTIFAGWSQFWPYKKSDVARYLTRWNDAMTWLAKNSKGASGQTYVHNAFWDWRSHDSTAAFEWLAEDANDPHVNAHKEYLKACVIDRKGN